MILQWNTCYRSLHCETLGKFKKRNNDQYIERSIGLKKKKKKNIFQNISIEKRKTTNFLENLHLAAGFIMCTCYSLSKRTFLN